MALPRDWARFEIATMTVSRDQLIQRFAELDDAVLLARLRADALTDEARELALAELRARGIDTVAFEPAPPAAEGVGAREDDDVEADDADTDASDSLSRLATYDFPTEAHLLRARLEAEGIPAWIAGADSAQTFGYLRAAVGGARVMVPTRLLADARAVMAALAAGEYALDEHSDGIAEDEAGPGQR
jgi:Putative prokaryotic signal transducing protein